VNSHSLPSHLLFTKIKLTAENMASWWTNRNYSRYNEQRDTLIQLDFQGFLLKTKKTTSIYRRISFSLFKSV